jgi:hypothetical protein
LGDVRQLNGSQSTATDLIEVVIETGGTTRVNAVALINIDAAAVQIVSETDDGEVYNETFSLVSTDGITDWYAYFFEEIVRKQKLVAYLPPYVAQTITVTLTDGRHGRARLADYRAAQDARRHDLRRASASTTSRARRPTTSAITRSSSAPSATRRRQGVVRHEPRSTTSGARSPATAPRPSSGSATVFSIRCSSSAFTRTSRWNSPRPEQILLHSRNRRA